MSILDHNQLKNELGGTFTGSDAATQEAALSAVCPLQRSGAK